MLKRTLNTTDYDALPDDVKSHYVKRGNSYVLDLEGTDPELTATQGQLDTERKRNVDLAAQVRTLTDTNTTIEANTRKESEETITKLQNENKQLVEVQVNAERDKHINAIASNFKLEGLIKSDVANRIHVEIKDGQVVSTFKDKDGKDVDFKTLNDEYCKNPDYSAILKGTENTPSYKAPAPNGSGGNQNKQQSKGGLDYGSASTQDIAADIANRIN